MLKQYVRDALLKALEALDAPGEAVEVTATDKPEFGDYASNVAFALAKHFKRAPREVGALILEALDRSAFERVEVAGGGFLNFTLRWETLHEVVRAALVREDFGRLDIGTGQRVQVEYVSANPTGPLTVGHGRNAVLGDTLANLFAALGYAVTREYYYNDAGRQMRVLGESVKLRLRELLGEAIDFPEDHYQGQYLVDVARAILDERGGEALEEDWTYFKDRARAAIFDDIQATLARLGIRHDVHTNEASFFENGAIWDVLEKLRAAGYAYDAEGAVWFKATAFGAEKDRVLVRSNGEPTYRLPDIAYHIDKLERGFDLVVDVLGTDHIVQTPDIVNAVKALGYDGDRVQPVFYQFVSLVSGGKAVKMSTRKANFVTLDELTDEVGADAVRYFMISRSVDAQMEFDLALAKSQSKDNPVYYIQYAHTRIAGILRECEGGVDPEADLSPLAEPESRELIKKLDAYPEALLEASRLRSPHVIANYAHQLAGLFHNFYERHKVLTHDPAVSAARLSLVRATQVALKCALDLLGVSAPGRM